MPLRAISMLDRLCLLSVKWQVYVAARFIDRAIGQWRRRLECKADTLNILM